MSKPKFAIIVPTYNRHDTIKKCLDSIFRKLDDLGEVIVVDDCSDEGFEYLLSDYTQNLKLLKTEKNLGAGIARQVGLEAATAEYVTFVDSDDYVESDIFRIMANHKYLDKMDMISVKVDIHFLDGKREVATTLDSLHGKFFKREFLLKNHIKFHPQHRLYEDTYFYRVCCGFANVVNDFDYVGYHLIENNNSTTKNVCPDWLNKTYDYGVYVWRSIYESYYGLTFTMDDILANIRNLVIAMRTKYQETEIEAFYSILNGLNVYYNIFDDDIFESIVPRLALPEECLKTLKKMRTMWINKNKLITLSVVIPLYNSYDHIINTLDNLYDILGNNIKHCEVILTDDASDKPYLYNDLEYAYENLRVIYNPTRAYMGGNRNRGIKNALGEWITFIDHDDLILSTGIEMIFDNSFRGVNIVSGSVLSTTRYLTGNPTDTTHFPIAEGRGELVHGRFYRREFLINNDIFFSEHIKTSEDSYFCRLAYLKTVLNYGTDSVYEDERPYYIWQWHSQSTMMKRYNNREYVEEFYKEHVIASLLAFSGDDIPEQLRIENYIKLIIDGALQIDNWQRNSANFKKFNLKILISILLQVTERYGISEFTLINFISENLKKETFITKLYMHDYYKSFGMGSILQTCFRLMNKLSNKDRREIKALTGPEEIKKITMDDISKEEHEDMLIIMEGIAQLWEKLTELADKK